MDMMPHHVGIWPGIGDEPHSSTIGPGWNRMVDLLVRPLPVFWPGEIDHLLGRQPLLVVSPNRGNVVTKRLQILDRDRPQFAAECCFKHSLGIVFAPDVRRG